MLEIVPDAGPADRGCATSPSSSAFAPDITWMALMKNSVVMRASFLFFPKPNKPRPGMMTTEGLESRSLRRVRVAQACSICRTPPDNYDRVPQLRFQRVDIFFAGFQSINSGQIRVRRKWSGQLVPRAPSSLTISSRRIRGRPRDRHNGRSRGDWRRYPAQRGQDGAATSLGLRGVPAMPPNSALLA